jgi:hypothetical protein
MEEKKRIGLLTLVIAVAGVVFAAIDAIVSVTYAVVPPEPSDDFFALVINGPIWWKINPIISVTLIIVGITAFLLGSDMRSSAQRVKNLYGFVRVGLTFAIISLSGLGDIISQTFMECFTGRYPFGWLAYDWWWTRFMPIPALIAFVAGHGIPSGIDMVLGSIVGLILLSIMWLHYYGKLSLEKIRISLTSIIGSNRPS